MADETNKGEMNKFDWFSPTDFRYYVKELVPYLSETAFTQYKGKVELALAKALAKHGLCLEESVTEVEKAVGEVTTQEVYDEEDRIRHDIKALVNMIRKRVSDKTKPTIHATATSYDIIDSANALRFRDAILDIILPDMVKLERTFIEIARREKDTLQIGRTHGQHAEPITFGFEIAQYVNRWGTRILKVKEAADSLVGKFSGAVGAYNASSLFFDEREEFEAGVLEAPEEFEAEILEELGLKPALISTQIVTPEPTTDLMHAVTTAFGVLANYARNMRNLQRTEIAEVGEPFEEGQVGSSTMPQKKNPINFENIEGIWKEFMPRIVTNYMDQVSEHQRDLTNSVTQRYIPESLAMLDFAVRRANRVSKKLTVNPANMIRNFEMSADKIIAEPLQILLAFYGHPDSHEKVRLLVMESYRTGISLRDIMLRDEEIKSYLQKFTPRQIDIISDPRKYTGIASRKAQRTADIWEEKIKLQEKLKK